MISTFSSSEDEAEAFALSLLQHGRFLLDHVVAETQNVGFTRFSKANAAVPPPPPGLKGSECLTFFQSIMLCLIKPAAVSGMLSVSYLLQMTLCRPGQE